MTPTERQTHAYELLLATELKCKQIAETLRGLVHAKNHSGVNIIEIANDLETPLELQQAVNMITLTREDVK